MDPDPLDIGIVARILKFGIKQNGLRED